MNIKTIGITLLILAAKFCCYSQSVPVTTGSTIITVITPTKILIAADSKRLRGKDVISGCKIISHNNIHIGITGATSFEISNRSIFDTHKIAEDVLARNLGYVETYSEINKKIISDLTKWNKLLILKHVYQLFKVFRIGSRLGLSYSTFINGRPFFASYSFYIDGNPAKWKIVMLKGNSIDEKMPPFNFRLSVQGHKDAIDQILKNNPGYINGESGLQDKIWSLMAKQVNASPNVVGFPIVIKAVYPDRSEWLTPHIFCPQ